VINVFCCRTPDCFSLGWPMRDDGEFFKSTFNLTQVCAQLTFNLQKLVV
jgi:hypothetical protein